MSKKESVGYSQILRSPMPNMLEITTSMLKKNPQRKTHLRKYCLQPAVISGSESTNRMGNVGRPVSLSDMINVDASARVFTLAVTGSPCDIGYCAGSE